MPFYAIIEPLMYKISLENTTYVDFGRETWMKNNCLKNYSWFYLSDPTFSDLNQNKLRTVQRDYPQRVTTAGLLSNSQIKFVILLTVKHTILIILVMRI